MSYRLVAFEHTRESPATNTLLFISGLNDGLLTIPYLAYLSSHLPPSFSFTEVLLSSSYSGWGTSSLTQDARELAECVTYFRELRPEGKIVLMGNSTGCQDVMHYLISDGARPKVDGAILQAPVSDREAMRIVLSEDEYQQSVETAQQWVHDGKGEDVLPSTIAFPVFGARCTANRWLSLASPGPEHAGEDDLFSSDFGDERVERVFGKAGKQKARLLILYSSHDRSVPDTVDKAALVKRWGICFVAAGGSLDAGSGILEGAGHTVKEKGEVLENFTVRVVGFLERVQNAAPGKVQ
ncbi:MAG: hypothetical protein LQ342_000097 [Letrouitia transgressa]|nr:MAG: hypothetical protein LQ342_000097 [Letrouitia transgressa]